MEFQMVNYIEISLIENVIDELWREGGDSRNVGNLTKCWGRPLTFARDPQFFHPCFQCRRF